MPYTAAHKRKTRRRIVECARTLFNRKGFAAVTIEKIMGAAGLTRGGFYNHFASKDELFIEAVAAYADCNPAERWEHVELDFGAEPSTVARQMINAYLSRDHLGDVDGHCPMIALPSDIARAGPGVRSAYEGLLRNMIAIFAASRGDPVDAARRDHALGIVALCIGGMVLARTLNDAALADDIREAARTLALEVAG